MRVQTSKVMADLLQKHFKKYTIYKTKMSENQFKYCVDLDVFNHDDDFDYKTNKYNVIVIEYPCEYYACNSYLTTKDLTKIFNKSDKTLDGFINAVKNAIEI